MVEDQVEEDPVEESQKLSVDEILEVAEAEKEQLGHDLVYTHSCL